MLKTTQKRQLVSTKQSNIPRKYNLYCIWNSRTLIEKDIYLHFKNELFVHKRIPILPPSNENTLIYLTAFILARQFCVTEWLKREFNNSDAVKYDI